MSWSDPSVLAALPLAVVAAWSIFRRQRGANSMPNLVNIKRLWADRRGLSNSVAATRHRIRGILFVLGMLCALAALARPQWGTIEEPTFEHAREVIVALDLSRSMLADDVKPTRLARAKLLIESLLEQLKGERVGLVVFAGTAFVQSPLSADYEVMRDLLKDLDPSYLPQGGTNYGAMLSAAAGAFGQAGDGDRFLVVLSDGEAHDEKWQFQVATLRDRGVRVIGLGVGTEAGAMLPDGKGGLLKDDSGGVVLSRLERRTLQQLAEQTHGAYRDAASWVDIAEVVRATVDQGMRGQYVEQKLVHQQDRFQWFLAPAVLLLLLSYWIELPVFPVVRTLRRQRPAAYAAAAVRAAALLLALVLAPRLLHAADARGPNALETTVAELSAKPVLAAPDFARLAQQTVAYASQPSAPAGPSRTGVIDDALTAVNMGEAADAHAADWPTLRKRLEQLKQAQQQQPQEQPLRQDGQQQKQNPAGAQQDQRNGQQGDQPQEAQRHGQAQQEPKGQQGSESGRSGEQQGKALGKSEAADAKDNDPQTEKRAGSNTSGQRQDKKEESTRAGDDQVHDTGAQHEVAENKEQKPLPAPEAGLGGLDAEKQKASSQNEPAPQPGTRLVGGGGVRQDKTMNGDPALAAALGRMDRVKDGDAPSVLFERMSQADNPHRPRETGKNW